jgi:hypothetical protein
MFILKTTSKLRHGDVRFVVDLCDQELRNANSLPPPGGLPCRAGVIMPVRSWRCSSLIALLSLIAK